MQIANLNSIVLLFAISLLIACKPEKTITPLLDTQTESTNDDQQKKQSDPADERMSWQKPDLVIESLGNIDDKVIADLGAGIGYFAFKLLPKTKKVIAIDIDQEKVDILNGFKTTLRESLRKNFEVRLATFTDPNLEPEEVDIIFIVNTIAYIQPRVEYLKNLKAHLKKDGQIFIVDFKTKKMPEYVHAPPYSDRLYLHTLEMQLEEAGYSNIQTDDTKLEYQYIVSANL